MASICFKSKLRLIISLVAFVPFVFLTSLLAVIARFQKPEECLQARIVFGPSPIINNKYWSNALKDAGYKSQTLMGNYLSSINKESDFDEYVTSKNSNIPLFIKYPMAFWISLFRFDVFVLSFNGWLLGSTLFYFLEPYFLKLAGKKVVIIPYGSDVYAYKNIKSQSLLHGLLMSYPENAKRQERVEKSVQLWTKRADCVLSAVMGVDGVGRWDVLRLSPLCIDLKQWQQSKRKSNADGTNDTVYITHAPNHKGFKGTEFAVDAVEKLKEEGLKVELILLQKVQNDEARRILFEETDILLEQLIFTGHGMNALEGMASGLPVISNLEDETYTTIFRRWSFFNECPIVSASPENVIDQLRFLVTRPKLREELGASGREYVEKHHDYNSFVFLFSNILKFIYGEKESLINLYHPLIGEYKTDFPKIISPLQRNKIVD